MSEGTRLRNKVAIVTGAAMGIGEGIALVFAREGARVVLVDMEEQKGQQVEQRIRDAGGEAFFMRVDLGDSAEIPRLVDCTVSRFGGLDILVNNAAIHGWINKKAVVDTTEEVWDRTLNVNLRAPYLLCKVSVPHMIRRGGGSIINIASIGGLEAFPEFAAYSTSKGGLVLLSKCLALDYGKYQIRANAICPGAIETPGSEPFMKDREAYMKTIAAITPLQRTGSPDDIAMAALYLGSDESRYVTGTTLIVDGGRMAAA
jgi:NAD(P)-dependent dehydrogenase (short-subunit alcohol dehydrogenase family)